MRRFELGLAEARQSFRLARKDAADRLAERPEINDVHIVLKSELDGIRGQRRGTQDDDLLYAPDGIFLLLFKLRE